jgi:hypothetical protein
VNDIVGLDIAAAAKVIASKSLSIVAILRLVCLVYPIPTSGAASCAITVGQDCQ